MTENIYPIAKKVRAAVAAGAIILLNKILKTPPGIRNLTPPHNGSFNHGMGMAAVVAVTPFSHPTQ